MLNHLQDLSSGTVWGFLLILNVFINHKHKERPDCQTGSSFKGDKTGIKKWKAEVAAWRGGGGGGDGAGHSGETVDYESHQVINDFINKTDHAAVIAVTRAEGWSAPNAPYSPPPCLPPSLPPFFLPPNFSPLDLLILLILLLLFTFFHFHSLSHTLSLTHSLSHHLCLSGVKRWLVVPRGS